jgi:hypothetical protein
LILCGGRGRGTDWFVACSGHVCFLLLLALQAADLVVVVNNIVDCNGLPSSSFTSISIEAIRSLRVEG